MFGLPGGSISQGGIFTIFGEDLGPDSPVTAASFPLPETLGGVSITVTQGDVVLNAFPLFADAGQINAVMPSNAPLGRASVRVMKGSQRSNPAPVTVVASSFGIFTATGSGSGPGIIQNVNTATERPINSPFASAEPGQLVTIWGTGLGPADFPDSQAPEAKNLPAEVEIFVGGVPVAAEDKVYSGRSPCCSGVDQIIFRSPPDAPRGCYVPVMIRTDGNVLSNAITMAIQPQGEQCSDPANPFGDAFLDPGRFASLLLIRSEVEIAVDVPESYTVRADVAVGNLREEASTPFPFQRFTSLHPMGSCTVYTGSAALSKGAGFPFSGAGGDGLDGGGEWTVVGARGRRTVGALLESTSSYGALLGGSLEIPGPIAFSFDATPYLLEGSYSVTGAGGPDIGPFSVDVGVAAPVEWTNREEVALIDRAEDLVLEWAGGAPSSVVAALGGNTDTPSNSMAAFFCLADAETGTLTVPAWVLGAIPPSRAQPDQSEGVVTLSTTGSEADRFSADGLDNGFALGLSVTGKTVIFE